MWLAGGGSIGSCCGEAAAALGCEIFVVGLANPVDPPIHK